jgi:hypothetical protein
MITDKNNDFTYTKIKGQLGASRLRASTQFEKVSLTPDEINDLYKEFHTKTFITPQKPNTRAYKNYVKAHMLQREYFVPAQTTNRIEHYNFPGAPQAPQPLSNPNNNKVPQPFSNPNNNKKAPQLFKNNSRPPQPFGNPDNTRVPQPFSNPNNTRVPQQQTPYEPQGNNSRPAQLIYTLSDPPTFQVSQDIFGISDLVPGKSLEPLRTNLEAIKATPLLLNLYSISEDDTTKTYKYELVNLLLLNTYVLSFSIKVSTIPPFTMFAVMNNTEIPLDCSPVFVQHFTSMTKNYVSLLFEQKYGSYHVHIVIAIKYSGINQNLSQKYYYKADNCFVTNTSNFKKAIEFCTRKHVSEITDCTPKTIPSSIFCDEAYLKSHEYKADGFTTCYRFGDNMVITISYYENVYFAFKLLVVVWIGSEIAFYDQFKMPRKSEKEAKWIDKKVEEDEYFLKIFKDVQSIKFCERNGGISFTMTFNGKRLALIYNEGAICKYPELSGGKIIIE